MPAMVNVYLQPGEGPRAAELLARSFQEEPLSAWQIPDREVRARLLPRHFESVVRLAEITGEVWRTDGFDAVACWIAPRRWPPTTHELEASGVARTQQLIGDEAWERFKVVYEAMDEAHERAVPGPHWDLWVVGVEPTARGRGVGSSLLEPTFARLDQANETCYLETLDARTLNLYERLGFAVVDEQLEPTSGLRFWCCVRLPNT